MAKLKVLKTLSEEDIAYVKKQKVFGMLGRPSEEVPEQGLSRMQLAAQRRQKMHKIYEQARKELSDLTLLAESLLEHQLKQVFTEEKLLPLFSAIFNLGEKLSLDEELLDKKRKRFLPLCFQIISLLDWHEFSESLAGPLRTVTVMEGGSLPGLRAIYYRSMIPEKKQKTKTTEQKSPRTP